MDPIVILKYLRFLVERANSLLEKAEIEGYDIAVLQRELGEFQRNFSSSVQEMPALAESIRKLELNVSDRDVGTDQVGPVRLAIKVLFGRGLLWKEPERKRQLEAKNRIRRFRDEISHLLSEIEG